LAFRLILVVMKQTLPELKLPTLRSTRDRLRDAALVLSSLQRAFLPKQPRAWQYGLEVNLRGLSTQSFMLDGQAVRATLDLVRCKVRLEERQWSLQTVDGPTLFREVQTWLQSKGVTAELEQPEFSSSTDFNLEQAAVYGQALWWLEEQFHDLKTELVEGVTSPILLYPHHFDLSLVWFPHDDERQLSVGFSTGDEVISEPYLYLTAYPEPDGFKVLKLPAAAQWQTDGFSGGVLPYAQLQASSQPGELLQQFTLEMFKAARPLLG
jgi:hypothetical protein